MAWRHQTRRNLGSSSGCVVAAENMSSITKTRVARTTAACVSRCAQSRGCQECLGRHYAGGGCYSSGLFEAAVAMSRCAARGGL